MRVKLSKGSLSLNENDVKKHSSEEDFLNWLTVEFGNIFPEKELKATGKKIYKDIVKTDVGK